MYAWLLNVALNLLYSGCSRDSVPHQQNMRLALQIAVIERTQRMKLFSDDHDEHTCRHDVCDNSSQPFPTRKCLPEARWPEKTTAHFY
jgi:hypothetical protein